jgi:putative flippase GtrA
MFKRVTTELGRLFKLLADGNISAFFHELLIKKHPKSIIKLFRYGFVAIAAYVVDFGLLVGLVSFFHMHYLIAGTISFAFGVAANYALSRQWVFPDSKYSRKTEMGGVLLIGIVGLILNGILLAILTDQLGVFYIYSKLIATVMVFFWNFFARHIFLKPAPETSI